MPSGYISLFRRGLPQRVQSAAYSLMPTVIVAGRPIANVAFVCPLGCYHFCIQEFRLTGFQSQSGPTYHPLSSDQIARFDDESARGCAQIPDAQDFCSNS